MASNFSTRPRQRAARWPRALGWAAASLSILLHGHVYWRLWSHVPEPSDVRRRNQPLDERTITFDLTPVPSPVAPAAVMPARQSAILVPATTSMRRKRRTPVPPVQPATPAARVPTAADLKTQLAEGSALPSDDWAAAAQSGASTASQTAERDGRALDLSVRAGPDGVRGAVAAVAGMMGSPVRGDTEKVGDIHSAMLVNKWIGQHHGELFRGCDRRQPGETMATFVERCPPKAQ